LTTLEVRAMLARVDPRQLRLDAGISPGTIRRALGISPQRLSIWERGKYLPACEAGRRWARFVAGLERHAAVTAEMAEERKRGHPGHPGDARAAAR
jgi:DNA-binding XRE family transcriptional regulator